MSDMVVSCGRRELLSLCGRLGSPSVFAGIHVGQLFSFIFFLFFPLFFFVSVSFVPNATSFRGLSVLHCHLGFR
jgi:hypothetical protein